MTTNISIFHYNFEHNLKFYFLYFKRFYIFIFLNGIAQPSPKIDRVAEPGPQLR